MAGDELIRDIGATHRRSWGRPTVVVCAFLTVGIAYLLTPAEWPLLATPVAMAPAAVLTVFLAPWWRGALVFGGVTLIAGLAAPVLGAVASQGAIEPWALLFGIAVAAVVIPPAIGFLAAAIAGAAQSRMDRAAASPPPQ
jgi:hypothetical protein